MPLGQHAVHAETIVDPERAALWPKAHDRVFPIVRLRKTV